LTSVAPVTGSSTGWDTGVTANGYLSADHSGDTACHGNRNLPRNTLCASRRAGFTNLSASCVWYFPSAGLLDHSAAGVRNLFGHTMCFHTALGVWNPLGDAVIRPGAGCVRNSLGAGLPGV
jgi:hypothetical protein